MSWICDYCSTANGDRASVCFVCGQERSRASARTARRAACAARRDRLRVALYRGLVFTAGFVFAASLFLFIGVAVITVCARVGEGRLDGLFDTATIKAEQAAGRLGQLLTDRTSALLLQWWSAPVSRALIGLGAMLGSAWGRMQDGVAAIAAPLSVRGSARCGQLYRQLVRMTDTLVASLRTLWGTISHLAAHVGATVRAAIDQARQIFHRVMESIQELANNK